MGKFTPNGYGYDVSEHRDCPYKEGLKCFLADCEDCPIHPDYESEEDIETFDSVYDEGWQQGWQQGFKKGYIAAMEEADEWVDEEDEEDFKPLTWEIEEPYCCYDKGLAEGSSRVEESYIEGYKACFLGEEPCIYDEDLEALLEQEGSFEGDTSYENGYIQGYKDCLVELKPAVTNADLDALIERCDLEKEEEEEEKELYKAESEPLGFIVDGELIDGIEALKEEILDIKSTLNEEDTIPVVQFRLYNLLHKLTVIQERVSVDSLHRYLGYK